jgi:hypothetical protein
MAPSLKATGRNLADPGQRSPEFEYPVMLVLVPLLTPLIVVPVLAAARHVGPDGRPGHCAEASPAWTWLRRERSCTPATRENPP